MNSPSGQPFVIAIDGPAGAGKSTVARGLAARLGYTFLDSGALYRTVALLAQEQNVAWDDTGGLVGIVRDLDIVFSGSGEKTRILAKGRDVTEAIRQADISEGASRVSALAEVRTGLLDMQRRVAQKDNVVAEGRDIGTVVFPTAQAKFFLMADPETRARRRTLELQAAGRPAVLAEVLAEMKVRDARDRERALAPLRRAEDAVEIDSSDLSPEEVMQRMLAVVRARGG